MKDQHIRHLLSTMHKIIHNNNNHITHLHHKLWKILLLNLQLTGIKGMDGINTRPKNLTETSHLIFVPDVPYPNQLIHIISLVISPVITTADVRHLPLTLPRQKDRDHDREIEPIHILELDLPDL